jgi:predicted nucleic acid-binding protein
MEDRADEGSVHRVLDRRRDRSRALERTCRKEARAIGELVFRPEGPQALFADRLLAFDEKAALIWARLMAEGTAAGRNRSALDMIITAVAEANDCVVVSDNENDFAGLEIINPLRTGT